MNIEPINASERLDRLTLERRAKEIIELTMQALLDSETFGRSLAECYGEPRPLANAPQNRFRHNFFYEPRVNIRCLNGIYSLRYGLGPRGEGEFLDLNKIGGSGRDILKSTTVVLGIPTGQHSISYREPAGIADIIPPLNSEGAASLSRSLAEDLVEDIQATDTPTALGFISLAE